MEVVLARLLDVDVLDVMELDRTEDTADETT